MWFTEHIFCVGPIVYLFFLQLHNCLSNFNLNVNVHSSVVMHYFDFETGWQFSKGRMRERGAESWSLFAIHVLHFLTQYKDYLAILDKAF